MATSKQALKAVEAGVTEQQLKTLFLRQRQSLPLSLSIEMSLRRIRMWREYWQARGSDVYVSLGGKDSHALLHLVRTLYPDVPGVFVDTGLEYPEVRELNLRTPNVTVIKPKMNFKQVIEKYGWPVISKKMAQYISETRVKTGKNDNTIHLRLTGERHGGTCPECAVKMERSEDDRWTVCPQCGYSRMISKMSQISKKWQFLMNAPFKISHKCCKVMKLEPLRRFAKENNVFPIIGTTSDESGAREKNWVENGCNAYHTHSPVSTPIIAWTEQHVLEYLKLNNIETAACYGDLVENRGGGLHFTGVQRTGCMYCAFGAHLEPRPNRFERMEKTHPEYHHYCMHKLGEKEILEYCGIPWRLEQGELQF